MHEIARHAHGTGAKQAMARRKLDNIGYVRGDSGFANDPDRILRINNQLKLMESVAAISKETSNAKAAETSLENLKLIEAAPAALAKLQEKDWDVSKLTMPEMCAIAVKHFKGTVLKGNKMTHTKLLNELITAQPGVLQAAADAAPSATLPVVAVLMGPPIAPLVTPIASPPAPPLALYAPPVSSEEESDIEAADEVMPAARPPASSRVVLCDWACDCPEMTAEEVEVGYCSGRRCKAKMHPECFLRHAGEGGAALDDLTCFCQGCWAQHS